MPKNKYICTQCDQPFYRYASTVRNNETVTCSKKCKDLNYRERFTGSNNPNYKGLDKKRICKCGRSKDDRASVCCVCSKTGYSTVKDVIITSTSHISIIDVKQAVSKSMSYNETAMRLNVARGTVTKMIREESIDISHFRKARGRTATPDETLIKRSSGQRRNATVKRCILENNLLEYKCGCGQGPIWNGKKLTLELDHINGDKLDDRIKNLRFMCPNCHTQTSTSRGKNIKKEV